MIEIKSSVLTPLAESISESNWLTASIISADESASSWVAPLIPRTRI
jgi:hypothetical protein